MTEPDDELMAKLNGETGRIGWMALLPHFARGQVVRVAPGLDLLEAATALARDDSDQVRRWMDEGWMGPVDEERARQWQQPEREVWAVVVAPWVVVQEA